MIKGSRLAVKLTRKIFKAIWEIQTVGFEQWQGISGPAIVVANHISLLDGPLLAALSPAPLHYAITGDFADRQPWKVALDVLSLTGHGSYSTLDPDKPLGVRKLHKALNAGHWVAIFPEGCISETGQLGAIQPGVLRLAMAGKAVILPVRISGTEVTRFGKVKQRPGEDKRPIVFEAREPIPPQSSKTILLEKITSSLS